MRKNTSSASSMTPALGEALSQPERAAAQQWPSQGEVAGLLFAEDGVPLRHLQQASNRASSSGRSARAARHAASAASRSAAISRWRGLPVGVLAREAELAEGGTVPVDALHGVRRRPCLHARQAAQQHLVAEVHPACEVPADELGQGGLHLPRRAPDYRQREQVLARRRADLVYDPDQLGGRRGLTRSSALVTSAGSAGGARCSTRRRDGAARRGPPRRGRC